MIRHIVVGANDLAKARAFYDATFAALGIAAATGDQNQRAIYQHDGVLFIVGNPIDGNPATHANGGTIGFTAPSEEAVIEWHRTGLAHGGLRCEGDPKKRVSPATGRNVAVAYLRDPDGNKLCAAFDEPA